jgi:hypothetical protein
MQDGVENVDNSPARGSGGEISRNSRVFNRLPDEIFIDNEIECESPRRTKAKVDFALESRLRRDT